MQHIYHCKLLQHHTFQQKRKNTKIMCTIFSEHQQNKKAAKKTYVKTSKGTGGKKNINKGNPWEYKDELPLLLEPQKLDRDKVSVLCCRDQYRIKPVIYEEPKQRDDTVYEMFGELVGQLAEFMRCWLRCHVLTHKKVVNKLACDYFKSKGMKLSTWLSGICTGKRANILVLFLLSKITNSMFHTLYM